jgi:DNA-binding CsgD family transcriptional regulator/tetratricopeptide (TPR) repeat protein
LPLCYARTAVATETVRAPLVGRAAEVEAVELFLDRIAQGAAALFLEGEPGIGKTRVWIEGVRVARERGSVVLRTRPAGADAEFAFAALGDLLRDVVEEVGTDLPPPQLRSLAAALQLEDPAAAVDRYAVSAALLGTLRLLAREQVVVLAIDDAQWLDPASRDVLAFALRRLDEEPVGLLATVRLAPETDVEAVLRALPEEQVTRMRLEPLSVASLYEIVRARFGLGLSRATLLRLHENSGGNPFYALEIARLLAARGTEPAPGEPLPVPSDLRELVEARLGELTAGSAELVLAAAALARPTVKVLARAFSDADDALAEASSAGILDVSGDIVRFSHPLLSSVHYETAPRGSRQRIHRELASAAEDSDERVRHLALASDEPDEAVASELEHAARRADRRGALAAAAELAELSLARTEDWSDRRVERTLLAADFHYALGRPSYARTLLDRALERTEEANQRAELLLKGSLIAAEEEGVEPSLALVREGLRVATDDGLRARLMLQLGVGRHLDYGQAVADASEAVALAERSGDPSVLVSALSALGWVSYIHTGEVPRETLERAAALEESTGRINVESGGAFRLAEILIEVGRLSEARRILERLVDIGRARNDVAQIYALDELAEIDLDEGRWDRSARIYRDAAEIAAQAGRIVMEGKILFRLAWLEAMRGNVEEAIDLCNRSTALYDQSGQPLRGPRLSRGVLELSRENYKLAWEFLDPSQPRNGTTGMGRPRGQVPEAIEALVGLGRLDEARGLLDPFEQRALEVDIPWAISQAARCRGLIAAGEGDLETAEAALLESVRLMDRGCAVFERARSQLALGTVQRRLRKKQSARATLREALTTFERLGARMWGDRTRAELRRIGGRSAPAGDELSATEARIVELARAGHTNREIAELMSVSPKTVEWNLSKIYRKLGVRSRTELAATR